MSIGYKTAGGLQVASIVTWLAAPQLLWRETPTQQASPTCRVSQRHRHRHEMEGKPQEPIDDCAGQRRISMHPAPGRINVHLPIVLPRFKMLRWHAPASPIPTITPSQLLIGKANVQHWEFGRRQIGTGPLTALGLNFALAPHRSSKRQSQLEITTVFRPIPFPMGCFASKPNPERADVKLARDHEVKKEWAQAEAIYRQILDKRIVRMHNFHPDYLVIMQRLQYVLLAQDPKSKEAKEIGKKVMSRVALSIPLPRDRHGNGENTETKFRGYLRQVHPWRKQFAKANEDAGETRRHYAALLGSGWQLRKVLGWRSDGP